MKKLIAIVLAVSLVLTLVLGSGMALAKPNNNGPKPGSRNFNVNFIDANQDGIPILAGDGAAYTPSLNGIGKRHRIFFM